MHERMCKSQTGTSDRRPNAKHVTICRNSTFPTSTRMYNSAVESNPLTSGMDGNMPLPRTLKSAQRLNGRCHFIGLVDRSAPTCAIRPDAKQYPVGSVIRFVFDVFRSGLVGFYDPPIAITRLPEHRECTHAAHFQNWRMPEAD